MVIRKLFKFEGAHIVRNCSSDRCKKSIHGHSYIVEVFLESDKLDNGHMVYDFGLFKGTIKDVIDSFDHSYSMWDQEKPEFQTFILENSDRVVTMPISPSAEGYAIMFAYIIDKILRNTKFNNGESRINLSSVRVSETATGYAEATMQDVYNLFDKKYSGKFDLNDIIFSPDVRREWSNPFMWDHLNKEDKFINPTIHITHG